mmetsp:Transcript_4176/g.15756  ORF Transcript_4176/g.15756 Transcript_4176/m.15756 type:complete len:520 (-) Transcript_4176:143-1702(-)
MQHVVISEALDAAGAVHSYPTYLLSKVQCVGTMWSMCHKCYPSPPDEIETLHKNTFGPSNLTFSSEMSIVPLTIAVNMILCMFMSKRKSVSILFAFVAFTFVIVSFFWVSSPSALQPENYIARLDHSEISCATALSNKLTHTLVEGSGGSGKTLLVLEHAQALEQSYSPILKLDMKQGKRLRDSIGKNLSLWRYVSGTMSSVANTLMQLPSKDKPALVIVDHVEAADDSTLKEIITLLQDLDPQMVKLVVITNAHSVANEMISQVAQLQAVYVDEPPEEHLQELLSQVFGITNEEIFHAYYKNLNYKQLAQKVEGGPDPWQKYERVWSIILRSVDEQPEGTRVSQLQDLIKNIVHERGVHYMNAHDAENSGALLKILVDHDILRTQGNRITFATKAAKHFFETNPQMYEDPSNLVKEAMKQMHRRNRHIFQRMLHTMIKDEQHEHQITNKTFPEMDVLLKQYSPVLEDSLLFHIQTKSTKKHGESEESQRITIGFSNVHLPHILARKMQGMSMWKRFLL